MPGGADNPNRAVYDRVAQDWEAERQPVDYGSVDAFAESLREDFRRGSYRGDEHSGDGSRGDEHTGDEHRGEGRKVDSNSSVCFDLGCGPGWYASRLPEPVVAVDSSLEMLRAVTRWAPNAYRVAADLQHLPFREHAARGVLASKCYLHLPKREVPMALGELHRATAVGALVELVCIRGRPRMGHFRG